MDSSQSFQQQQQQPQRPVATSASTSTSTVLLSETKTAGSSSNNNSNNSSSNNNECSSSSSTQNLSVGFVGCGTIASAIARGLIRAASNSAAATATATATAGTNSNDSDDDTTPAATATAAAAVLLSVAGDNQEILDKCDLIFLTVLPQQASSVLKSLDFDPDRHVLVSLVSTANLEDLARDSGLDPSRVAKMICLPSIAYHKGVALLCCGGTTQAQTETQTQPQATTTRRLLVDLFGATGGVVALDTEADLEACMVTTCTMGPLYGTMKNQRDWLLAKTGSLSREDATLLVIKQFAGAVFDAEQRATTSTSTTATTASTSTSTKTTNKPSLETRLEDLIEEQTPGGLNEQALKNYGTVLGGFADLQEPVMDAILSRIRGETDGSIDRSKE
eukprot:jgi/Psemu1/255514/estExt_Genewise1Plus.C_1430043